jgi:hypothetical protein
MVMLAGPGRSGIVQVSSATILMWHCSNPLLELWSLNCVVVSSLSGLDTTNPHQKPHPYAATGVCGARFKP